MSSVVSRSEITGGDQADPSRDTLRDAAPPSDNPLATGKKDVTPVPAQEWGTLRYGVPKGDGTFGLPTQAQPPAASEPTTFNK